MLGAVHCFNLNLRPAVDIQQLGLMSSCMVASKPVNFCLLRGRNQANFSLLNENVVGRVTGEQAILDKKTTWNYRLIFEGLDSTTGKSQFHPVYYGSSLAPYIRLGELKGKPGSIDLVWKKMCHQ